MKISQCYFYHVVVIFNILVCVLWKWNHAVYSLFSLKTPIFHCVKLSLFNQSHIVGYPVVCHQYTCYMYHVEFSLYFHKFQTG